MTKNCTMQVARWMIVLWSLLNATNAMSARMVRMPSDGDPIYVGERFKFDSKILGETRTYSVHKPNRYDFGKESYPVLVLLDGSEHFAHTSATMEFLAANGRMPQMIVVAIGNTNRQKDMTPALTTMPAQSDTGGIDKFLGFIGDELLPEIDRRYRTRPYRVIIGHSLGGLVVIESLVKRPELFRGYLAISPSLWWDNQTLVKEAEGFLTSHKDLHADFYMTMGNEGKAMLGGAWKLSAGMEEQTLQAVRWKFVRSPEENHGTIPYRSTYDGLQYIFDGWDIADPKSMFEQVGFAGIEAHYAKLSERIGYSVAVPGRIIAAIFYLLLEEKRYSEAEAIVNRELQLFSHSPYIVYVYANAGRLYAAQDDEQRAIEYMKKAIALYPGDSDARDVLAKYKVDISKLVRDTKISEKSLAALVGSYRAANVYLEISREGDRVYAATDGGKFEIRPLSESKFYYMNADANVEFHKDKRGRIAKMTMERFGDRYDYYKLD